MIFCSSDEKLFYLKYVSSYFFTVPTFLNSMTKSFCFYQKLLGWGSDYIFYFNSFYFVKTLLAISLITSSFLMIEHTLSQVYLQQNRTSSRGHYLQYTNLECYHSGLLQVQSKVSRVVIATLKFQEADDGRYAKFDKLLIKVGIIILSYYIISIINQFFLFFLYTFYNHFHYVETTHQHHKNAKPTKRVLKIIIQKFDTHLYFIEILCNSNYIFQTQTNNKFIHQINMPKSEHSQSFSVNSQSGSRFNQTQKMQMEADHYTKKYEWERRNLMTLKGVESTLQNQVATLKNSVAKLKKQSEDGQVKVMFTKMRNLQKQIDINDKKYNETMGDIDKLKREIDLLRQEKSLYQSNLAKLEDDIEKADSQITQLMTEIQSSQSTSKMSQNMMLNLKMKNQQDKTNYYRKLNELNRELKDPRLNKNSRIRTGEVSAIQNDTATILKNRLTKLIVNNKEKVKLIDNYQRNMKVIDQAFNTIKEATGLTDIEEIQNTFIKGEEQNYNLLTYVDVLNQEIDTLADGNQTLRLKNQSLKIENAEKQRLLTGTPDDEKQRKKIQQYIDTKKKQVDEFQLMLNEIQPHLKDVLIKLAGSKFNRSNPHRVQEYQNSGVTLNDTNLQEYLSELEEYTNAILIYRGKSNNLPNSEVFAKTLLLDELAPKQFKKKVYDNTQLYGVLDDTKDKTKGIQKILDREQLEDMAKKQLEKAKNTDQAGKAKKK